MHVRSCCLANINLRFFTFLVVVAVVTSELETLRSEDGDDRENVAEKVNSRSFNLHRDYSK